ncbi:hypothetical protein LTR62_000920 [Meristemomyces frigidus]|uniref:DUF7580 domain-containing protein n=1 Tax=Meristemomyces frigidus TaxID=1508187 RepID=A0AAN7T8Z4_9PEZI|nr:hypothetical protein LTR62_000920 [Meristemomyces frigidus]
MTAAGYNIDAPITAARQKNKDGKVINLYKLLHDELSCLDVCLRGLVQSLPLLDERQRAELLKLDGSTWELEITQRALWQRLGPAQHAFADNLEIILKTLEDILSTESFKLKRSDSTEAGRPMYANLRQLRRDHGKKNEGIRARIRFTRKERKLAKGVQDITSCSGIIQRLLGTSSMPAFPQVVSRKITGKSAPPKKICELAQRVHTSFMGHWPCSCHVMHEARLCINVAYEVDPECLPTRLDLFIAISDADKEQRRWQKSFMTVDPLTIISQPDLSRPASTPHVSFQITDPGQPVSKRRRRSSATEDYKMPITAMCTLVERAHRNGVGFDLLLNNDRALNKDQLLHIKSNGPSARMTDSQTQTSLHDLLISRDRFTVRDRRRLAVILAHALLHLKGSHWLRDSWSKDDVRFMHLLKDGRADVRRPYVSYAAVPEAGSSDDDATSQLHECPPLLGLGIVLLELGLSHPIDQRREEMDMMGNVPHINTNFFTAMRVLDDSEGDLQKSYWGAVQACLTCSELEVPGSGKAFDFSDDVFRGMVYEHVVAPLEAELFAGWGEKLEDLWDQDVVSGTAGDESQATAGASSR